MNSGKKRRKAVVEESDCVACGCCVKVCPPGAIQVLHGIFARVSPDQVRRLREMCPGMPGQRDSAAGGEGMKKHWHDSLWIVSLLYLLLGFFNILFSWLGLACFFLPLLISVITGSKAYCNRYCGRGPSSLDCWTAGSGCPASTISPTG